MVAAEQTQKFPFLFFVFRRGVRGGAAQNARKFWVSRAALPRAEALPAQSGRTLRVQATTCSAHAKWVRAAALTNEKVSILAVFIGQSSNVFRAES